MSGGSSRAAGSAAPADTVRPLRRTLTEATRRLLRARVLRHYAGDVTRANIHPGKRRRILARYGAGGADAGSAQAGAGTVV